MKDITNLAIGAAREAGIFLKNNFGKVSTIETKGDRNFATNLDKEAEKMIVERIKTKFPDHGILAEEGGEQNADREYVWIIDPLDGTHNFIRNINIFGVSIGVAHKGKFISGAVYMPVDDQMYSGEKGAGAYKNNKKISVSSIVELKECSMSFDSSIRYSPDPMLKSLREFAHKVFNLRMMGSSARHLTYLVDGSLDCVVEYHDNPWDFAGSVAIIEEAGGKITSLDGKPITYRDVGYIASNGVIHDKILDIVWRNR